MAIATKTNVFQRVQYIIRRECGKILRGQASRFRHHELFEMIPSGFSAVGGIGVPC